MANVFVYGTLLVDEVVRVNPFPCAKLLKWRATCRTSSGGSC